MNGKCVLLATDLSDAAVVAARRARDLGAIFGLPVVVAHVIEAGAAAWMASTYAALADPEQMDAARRRVDAWYRRVTEAAPSDVSVTVDDCYSGLVSIATDHDPAVLVMARTGKGAVLRTLLGSRVQAIVARPPCPVLIVHPDARPLDAQTRLAVGVDFSPLSAGAVRVGVELARRLGVGLRLVHSIHLPDLPALPDVIIPPANEGMIAQVDDELKALAADLAADLPAVDTAVLLGGPVGALTRDAEARATDLLIVAHKGHRSRLADFLGSVARGLVVGAPCSVLVVGGRGVSAPGGPRQAA